MVEIPGSIGSEELAYCYLRLNGFLTVPNFVVHPEWGNEQRTDVDILGVRFPHRAELFPDPMADEEVFTKNADKPFVIMTEVKKDLCDLNRAWTTETEQHRKSFEGYRMLS